MYVIKRKPEDFIVEEVMALHPQPTGDYLIVRMTKRERNTEEVAQLLAERLRIRRRDVGYAGAKDRNAVATQHFSLKGVKEERLAKLNIPGVTIAVLGHLDAPLGLGVLEGNRFTITVRNLEGDEDLSLPKSVPNYFDEQRFGGNNAAIGKALLKKEFAAAISLVRESSATGAPLVDAYLAGHPGDAIGALLRLPRQLLRMYLHAYQSLLWNRALAQYVSSRTATTKKIGYSVGEFVFPRRDVAIEDISLPLLGFSTTTPDSSVMAILSEEKISPRDFVIRQLPNLSLEGELRAALIVVEEFSVSDFADDEEFSGKKKAVLRFSLPKGSYATVVVRALLA
jgi:tRNA pseudouridine13 synthase